MATIIIVVALLIPVPFARFESWPTGRVLSEHLILPWSVFRVCYGSYPDGEPVVERYEFTWKGEILPREGTPELLMTFASSSEPLLKWQNLPEEPLRRLFQEGDLLKLKTIWQPLLIWPLAMVVRASMEG